jgi:hypothetical protein
VTDPSRLLAAALADLLASAGYPVEVGEVTTPDDELTYPYLVLWPPPVVRGPTSLDATSDQQDVTFQVTAVGRDEDETLAAADRAADALVDQVPTIAGRTFNQIQQEPLSQPPRPDPGGRDPQTRRPVFVVPVMFSTWSVPG